MVEQQESSDNTGAFRSGLNTHALRDFFAGANSRMKSPGDFGHFAGVVVDIESAPQLLIHFNALDDGLGRGLICLTDSLVRFQETEAIVKLNRKGVFRLVEADVFDAAKTPLAKCGFAWVHGFHIRLSFTNCWVMSITSRGGFQSATQNEL
jgi:hypothetical protein